MTFVRRACRDLPEEDIRGVLVRSLFRPEEADQMTVRWVRVGAGGSIPATFHRVAREVLYVLEGSAEFTIGEETVVGAAGDFLHIPPGAPHALEAGAEGVCFLAIESPPVDFGKDLEFVDPTQEPFPR